MPVTSVKSRTKPTTTKGKRVRDENNDVYGSALKSVSVNKPLLSAQRKHDPLLGLELSPIHGTPGEKASIFDVHIPETIAGIEVNDLKSLRSAIVGMKNAYTELLHSQNILDKKQDLYNIELIYANKMKAFCNLSAQDALISSLRAENLDLLSRVEADGDIPSVAVLQSKTYLDMESRALTAEAKLKEMESQLMSMRAKPSISTTSQKLLQLFSTLTAIKIRIREVNCLSDIMLSKLKLDPNNLHDDYSLLGIYDCSTTCTTSNSEITFSLEFFPFDSNAEGVEVGEDGDSPLYPTGVCVEFTPLMNLELLPDFLQSPIIFGSEQCPMFLAKLTESIRHMDEYENKVESVKKTTNSMVEKAPEDDISTLKESAAALMDAVSGSIAASVTHSGTTAPNNSFTLEALPIQPEMTSPESPKFNPRKSLLRDLDAEAEAAAAEVTQNGCEKSSKVPKSQTKLPQSALNADGLLYIPSPKAKNKNPDSISTRKSKRNITP